MSEHRDNMMALLAATMPTFPPHGRAADAQLGLQVMPKRNVILVRDSDARVVDGERQFRRSDDGAWEKVQEGAEVHVLGKRLPDEKCDVVVTLVMAWADLASVGPGRQPRTGAHIVPGEFARVDLRAYLRIAEASLGEEKRILAPGLSIVKG